MKTRGTSARQAAARSRIQQTDTFSGSAPPFEHMTDTPDSPGWSMNPRKADERRYLTNMIQYLHDDPTVYDNLEILRFIYKEWPRMATTIHTKTTMDTLKRRLLSMHVRYIHRGKDPGDWAYWRDYTDDGMLEYHVAPADMTPMQYPTRDDKEYLTPAATTLARNPRLQSVTRDEDDDDTLPDDALMPPLTQMDSMTFAQHLHTDPTTAFPDNATPSSQNIATSLENEMHHIIDTDMMHATVLNPYTGKHVAVTMHPTTQTPTRLPSVDNAALPDTIAKHLLADLKDEDLADLAKDAGISDGFTPVLPRHGRRPPASNNVKPTWKPPPTLPHTSVHPTETMTFNSDSNVTHIPLPTSSTDAITHPDNLPGPSQPALETFTDILNDRLQDAFLQLERKEQQHKRMIEEYMADITHHKEDLLQREQQLTTTQQRFNQRQHIYIARMNHWEGDVMSQEATVTRKRIELDTAMAEFDQTISTATTRCNDLADQTKRSMRAWIEVTLEKLKTDLDIYKTAHKAHTEEFCTEQMSALESYLDSYSGHAAGIHANLLVRLRRDITRTYHDIQLENQTSAHAAIPLDDDTVEDDETLPTQQTGNVTTNSSARGAHHPSTNTRIPDRIDNTDNAPAGDTPFPVRRWKDVDYDLLHQPPPRHGSTGPTPPTSGYPPPSHKDTFRPTLASPHSDVDQQISNLRKANTPTHLRGRDRKSVTVFYNSFVDFHKIYRVPFKILDDLRIDKLDDISQERLHPPDLLEDPTLYDRYSSAIYARLEEDGVLDPSDQLYQGLLQMYNSKRDGYRLLQDILATTLLVPSKNIGQLSTPPTVHQGTTPYDFACQLKEFYACQLQHNRTYTVREQATMFLQGMQHASSFTHAATQLLHDMHQIPDAVPLPLRLAFPNNLPLTLLTSAETMRSHSNTSATINVTRSTARTRSTDARHTPDRDRSRERRPSYDGRPPRDSSVERDSTMGRAPRLPPQRTPPVTAGPRPTARNPDVQCAACATNGHTAMDCRQLPKIAACMEYITTHPTESNATLRQYRRTQHPEHRRMARDRIINVLQTRLQQGTLEDEDGMEAIVDQLTGDFSDDDYLAPIFHLRADTPDTLPNPHCMENIPMPTLTTDELRTTIHPVKYPDISEFSDMRRLLQTTIDDNMTPIHSKLQDNTVVQPLNVTRVTPRLDTRRDLADTGASVSATGLLHILHQFTPDTMYEIMGYDGTVTKATGQGVAHVYQAATGKTEPMLFVYVPTITGTIISLEHHARTHPAIHRWVQEATPSHNSGWVAFYDVDGKTVSSYPTILDKGLYYIQDMTFIPTTNADAPGTMATISTTHHHRTDTTPLPSSMDDETVLMANPTTPINCVDYDLTLIIEHTQSMLSSDIPTNPVYTDYTPPRLQQFLINRMSPTTPPSATVLGRMEKDVLNFEVWHQRFAHCSEKRLRLTQKLVDGVPHFHNATIPHIVSCRACDVAKLRKAPRGPATIDPPTLEKGQVFHMDIGFIRGPANLTEVLARTQDAEPKVIESRQGYVCYLLIIDSKTRYGWPFPMKSKSVPPTLIHTFLQTHGNHTAVNRRIRTDGEGSLAESTIFRKLVAELGYTLEKTATDSSSQNGIAERPHQTLATMVRCLLYASSLPTPFWADALVYANYVNNRLYNSGIAAIPYTQWTGRRANVKHLRAFGAHVSVKRSGNRPTKTDPHYYNGRFLRFGATERNIIYYDTVTKRDKTARHCRVDEFHYGSPPSERPHGAQHLLKQVLPNYKPPNMSSMNTRAAELPTDEFLVAQPDIPLPIDALHETLDAHPTTAVAAQLLADHQHQAILHLDTSPDMYSQPITIQIPINRLPTLGLITHMDTTTGQLFLRGCQEGTFCNRIPRWRSTIRNSVVRSINSIRIRSRAHMIELIQESRQRRHTHVTMIFAKIAVRTDNEDEIPQLHFDQLRHLNQLHIALRAPTNEAHDAFLNFTRAQLRKRPDYDQWRQSEWQQHDKYALQNMFGRPIPRPEHAIVLPFVWNYSIKEDPITGAPKRKARGTCNGGKRYGKAVTVAETYATCVEQPACRLYWAVTASEGLIAMGADAGNAFAEAPPPEEPFFMRIDDQFAEWWVEHLGNPPIPPGYVLPVNHALQGHPEASRLWETHIHGIIVNKLHFTPTTHEKCLYSKRDPDGQNLQMILRQVDDFSVSADSQDQCQHTIATIGSHLQVPLNDLGIIRKFNGVNVLQTRWYIKISCEDYILRILMHHNWQDLKASNLPIPMRNDSKYQRDLELATRPDSPQAQQNIQNQAGFSYRMTIGELIYALVVARVDISFAIIKLSQYGANPASIHYQAVRQVFAFLNHTRTDGLIFWRKSPRQDLPLSDIPTPRSNPQDRLPTPSTTPTRLLAYSDSDWGSDAAHRRSVTGTIILLSGAAVLYSTKYQKAVALSSTEAEFVAASDTGKTAIYMRTILSDLGFSQDNPTQLLIDNTGAVFMIDAQAPTKRTRHVDIRYFALLQWSHSGQIKAEAIPTDANISDSLTKATGRIKFHQHADIYMGRSPPLYVPPAAELLPHVRRIHTFSVIPVSLDTFSALHHHLISSYVVHPSDYIEATEHGRVRGYSPRSTVATS